MSVLIKPLVTEKASSQNEGGKYGFVVNTKANKVEIKKEIEKLYGVNVVDVNTIVYRGKIKYRQTKTQILEGRTKKYKKAIVTVADGEIIDFYSNI